MSKRRHRHPEFAPPRATQEDVVRAETKPALKPITFPAFAEKYFGKSLLAELHAIATYLEEYELLVTQRQMPLRDVIDYLNGIGAIDEIRSRLQTVTQQLNDKVREIAAAKQTKEHLSARHALKLATGAATEIIFLFGDRPIISALLGDVQLTFSINGLMEQIQRERETDDPLDRMLRLQKDPLFYENQASNDLIRNTGEQTDSERTTFLCDAVGPIIFARQLQHEQVTFDPEMVTNCKQEADAMIGDLLQLDLEPMDKFINYTGSDLLPQLINIHFGVQADDHALILARGVFSHLSPDRRKRGEFSISLSRINRELHISLTMVSSPEAIFAHYGVTPAYQVLRWLFAYSLYDAVTRGLIKIRRDQVTDAISAKAEANPDLLSESPEPEAPSPIAQPQPEPIIPEVLQPSTEPQPTPTVEPVAPRTPRRPSGVKRNIRYETAINALQRCGVTVTAGGRHPILERTNEQGNLIRAAFANKHSASRSGVSPRVLKQVLRILEIDPPDFIDALK